MTVDAAGFGAGGCTTFVDPWPGPGGAELDNKGESDDSAGFPPRGTPPTASLSLRPTASPTQLSRLWVCTPHRRVLDVPLALVEEPRERSG